MATTRPLEDTEIQKLFANIAGRHVRRNRTMIWLGIAGALRATELVSLTVGDVYDGREVKTYLTIRGETAKFGKERIIRIGGDVRQTLADYIRWKNEQKESLKTDAPLFLSQKGGPLTRQMLHVILRRVFKPVGIDQSPHALRKTGAMIYYQQSDYDIEATRAFLGHADLSTTRKYLGLASEKVIEYSERTAKHLRGAIESGDGEKFDTSMNMSNFSLDAVPTAALIFALSDRGLDVEPLAAQVRAMALRKTASGEPLVIPFTPPRKN